MTFHPHLAQPFERSEALSLKGRAGREATTIMKESTKRTWKRVFDIVVTILTALITSITASSCMQ